jgi:transcriptional regulator with XRE-family HTH domain
MRWALDAAGSTLADLSARCGIDQPALSRLYNGHTPNPTLDTIRRYAAGLGKRLVLTAEDVSEMRGRGGWMVLGWRRKWRAGSKSTA